MCGAGADEEERKETKETVLLWLTGGRGAKKPHRRPRLGQEAERCGRAMMMATPLSATSLARSRGGAERRGLIGLQVAGRRRTKEGIDQSGCGSEGR